MSLNPVSCGSCGTVNPPDRDFCVECGGPLTGSADEGLRESAEARDRDGVIGAAGTAGAGGQVTAAGPGLGTADPGLGTADPGILPRG